MDVHAMPGVVHVACEVPEAARVLRLGPLRRVPCAHDQLALAGGKDDGHLPEAPGIRISALDDSSRRPGLRPVDREFDPLHGRPYGANSIALDTQRPRRAHLTVLRCRDHGVEAQLFQGLSSTPWGGLPGHLGREDLVIARLVRVGRGALLELDLAEPLDTSRADVARHDDPQWEPMLWSQRLIVHLIRQEHIWREGFLKRDGAAKMYRLPLELGLIETGERNVVRPCP